MMSIKNITANLPVINESDSITNGYKNLQRPCIFNTVFNSYLNEYILMDTESITIFSKYIISL